MATGLVSLASASPEVQSGLKALALNPTPQSLISTAQGALQQGMTPAQIASLAQQAGISESAMRSAFSSIPEASQYIDTAYAPPVNQAPIPAPAPINSISNEQFTAAASALPSTPPANTIAPGGGVDISNTSLSRGLIAASPALSTLDQTYEPSAAGVATTPQPSPLYTTEQLSSPYGDIQLDRDIGTRETSFANTAGMTSATLRQLADDLVAAGYTQDQATMIAERYGAGDALARARVEESVGTVGGVERPTNVARAITPEETVRGQLQTLIDEDSPYIQSARNRALEVANARGMVNSSLAAGSAERAAIEAAAPIAGQDASTYAAAGLSAQNANQGLVQTGYTANLGAAQASESAADAAALSAQNAQQTFALNQFLQSSAMAQQVERLASADRTAFMSAVSPVYQQTLSEISAIQRTPDEQMSPDAKATAIAKINDGFTNWASGLASIAGYTANLTWDSGIAGSAVAPATSAAQGATAGTPEETGIGPVTIENARTRALQSGLDESSANAYQAAVYRWITTGGRILSPIEFANMAQGPTQ